MNQEENNLIQKKVEGLREIFSNASIGDFSKDVPQIEKDDEFAELYVGVQVMLDVIRERIGELKHNSKQLEVLLNNLPVGVYVSDNEGKAILTNKKARDLVGSEFDPNVGAGNYSETYSVTDLDGGKYPDEEHPIAITLRTKQPAEKKDIVINRGDNNSIVLKVQSEPVFNEQGDIVSVIAVLDDITKETELDRLQVEFVSLASHQLRTPLGTMRWGIEMLIEEEENNFSEETKNSLKDVHSGVVRMVNLVDKFLNVTRLAQGKIPENPTKINILETVKNCVSEHSSLINDYSLNVNYEVEDENISINIDPTLFSQVINNLLDNAILYNKDGGDIVIKIITKDGFVHVSVKDTGIGIKKEEIDNIYKKFYRSKDASQKNTEGTGLGLFIVDSYIQGWGGYTTVESEYGKSTTVTVSLPLEGTKELGVAKDPAR